MQALNRGAKGAGVAAVYPASDMWASACSGIAHAQGGGNAGGDGHTFMMRQTFMMRHTSGIRGGLTCPHPHSAPGTPTNCRRRPPWASKRSSPCTLPGSAGEHWDTTRCQDGARKAGGHHRHPVLLRSCTSRGSRPTQRGLLLGQEGGGGVYKRGGGADVGAGLGLGASTVPVGTVMGGASVAA